jgi:hypothetical protein
MDKVRLGRAFGYGARHAARTVTGIFEAATAPDPSATAPARPEPAKCAARPQQPPPTAAAKTHATKTHVAGLRRSVLQPVKKFSSVLWLEVTGTFFAIGAITMSRGAWMFRTAIHASPKSADAIKLYASSALCLLFAYFAISSFLRAHRYSRR